MLAFAARADLLERECLVRVTCILWVRAALTRMSRMQEPVTAANREEYVQLYTEWVLNKSISKQFDAFSKGFHQVGLR